MVQRVPEEAFQCKDFLEEKLGKELSATVFDVGKGRVTERTQHILVEEKEVLDLLYYRNCWRLTLIKP